MIPALSLAGLLALATLAPLLPGVSLLGSYCPDLAVLATLKGSRYIRRPHVPYVERPFQGR